MSEPRVIRRRIRRSADGINVAADINAVIATGDVGSSTAASSTQRTTIVQTGRSGQKRGRPTTDSQEESNE